MKNLKILMTFILLVIIPVIMNAQEKVKKTETVVFSTSIDCKACVDKIMSNIPQEKGIKDVKCDLSNSQVTVTYQKEKTNTEQIQRSIEKLGYIAKPTPEDKVRKEIT